MIVDATPQPAQAFPARPPLPPRPVVPPGPPLTPTDRALIDRAKEGDQSAFAAIFDGYQTAIFNYVYRMMGDKADAADLTQDTFVKAYLGLRSTSADLKLSAWLYRIATNVCLDELRHRKLVTWHPWASFITVFHPAQVAADNPERDAVAREDAAEVQAILQRVAPKYRTVLLLREYYGLSYDEMADALTTTRAAVKSLLFRAREEFRQVYARSDRQPGRAVDPADPLAARTWTPKGGAPPHDGGRLRARRKALRLSQKELAARFGCNHERLGRLETRNVADGPFRRRAWAAVEAAEAAAFGAPGAN